MWDFDSVEEKKSIIHGVVTKFGANVANMNVFQRLMGLQISDLADERVRAIGFAPNYQLCHYNSMVCSSTKRSNPPFRSSQMWGVQDESLVFGIPCGSCFQASNIRTMPKLGLSITSDRLVVFSRFEKELVLLWCALVTEGGLAGKLLSIVKTSSLTYQIHACMKSIGTRFTD